VVVDAGEADVAVGEVAQLGGGVRRREVAGRDAVVELAQSGLFHRAPRAPAVAGLSVCHQGVG